MILLIGGDAYSPFRLDELKDAIAKLDPGAGAVKIDARWVYAVEEASGGADAGELQRASTLLNAEGLCDGADFYVTPRKGIQPLQYALLQQCLRLLLYVGWRALRRGLLLPAGSATSVGECDCEVLERRPYLYKRGCPITLDSHFCSLTKESYLYW